MRISKTSKVYLETKSLCFTLMHFIRLISNFSIFPRMNQSPEVNRDSINTYVFLMYTKRKSKVFFYIFSFRFNFGIQNFKT
ncbi:LOW QUALITY PROTEIN: succinyl-CoA synthetase beta chain, putative, partial [Schistosoma mansoni]|uniref:succinyl-CoA synthetase beta chain, putative n=1 Tax=Schistosoma mansoni TaxID=6183 RepID=UPI00022C81E5